MSVDVASFETRASLAEKQIEVLTNRLQALEKNIGNRNHIHY